MDNIVILQEMLQYIDNHIKEKMTMETLAQRSGYSQAHFCKMFKNYVGISVMEYVRNRQLAYAASELNSNRKLQDIALDYGFITHSGFSKAFRRFFGCPPEIFRTYACFNVPAIQDLAVSNQFESDMIIEPKIFARKKAFKIAGYTLTINNRTDRLDYIYKFKIKCIEEKLMEKLHNESFIKHHAEYGISFLKNIKDEQSTFVVGLEARQRKKIPPEYSVYTLPESLYAVFSVIKSIPETWQYILSEWLPYSGYEYNNNALPFEFFDGRNVSDSVCDIYFPVVKVIQ